MGVPAFSKTTVSARHTSGYSAVQAWVWLMQTLPLVCHMRISVPWLVAVPIMAPFGAVHELSWPSIAAVVCCPPRIDVGSAAPVVVTTPTSRVPMGDHCGSSLLRSEVMRECAQRVSHPLFVLPGAQFIPLLVCAPPEVPLERRLAPFMG